MYEGIAAVYRDVVGDLPYGQWSRFARDAWSPDPRPVRRVLDVCCGTGLMSAELIAAGYEVSGVDGSEPMLAEARTLLGPSVPLEHAVLPDLPVRFGSETFDAAVCAFDSLNYLTLGDARRSLAAVAAALRPGGWFVFDLHTEQMMRTIADAPLAESRSGRLHLRMSSEVDLVARTSRTRVEITPDDGAAFTEEHVQHFFGADDVRAAVVDAGMVVVSVTDDYTAAPLDDESLRAMWSPPRPSS